MHKFQNFKCGCLKQRKPIHFWVACTLPPTIVNSSLTHHFFLISSFLFLLTKKGKTTFSSNQVTSKKEISPWLKYVFLNNIIVKSERLYIPWGVCVCMCVCTGMYGWACSCTYEDPLPYFLETETGLLTEPGARLVRNPSSLLPPLPTAKELETYAVMLDFLHECWRFELKFSGLYRKWSFLLSHLQPQMFIYLTNVHVINE